MPAFAANVYHLPTAYMRAAVAALWRKKCLLFPHKIELLRTVCHAIDHFLMSFVLNLILSHESARAVARMLAHWSTCVAPDSLLLAYGGSESEFPSIDHKPKFLVEDKRLRTKDHQREFQSYTGLFRAAAEFLKPTGAVFNIFILPRTTTFLSLRT